MPSDQMTNELQAAAWHGIALNTVFPLRDRWKAAVMALEYYAPDENCEPYLEQKPTGLVLRCDKHNTTTPIMEPQNEHHAVTVSLPQLHALAYAHWKEHSDG